MDSLGGIGCINKLVTTLRDEGIAVWSMESIRPGEAFQHSLERHIEAHEAGLAKDPALLQQLTTLIEEFTGDKARTDIAGGLGWVAATLTAAGKVGLIARTLATLLRDGRMPE